MSISILSGLLAVALYVLTLVFLRQAIRRRGGRITSHGRVLWTGIAAVCAHFVSAWTMITAGPGYLFGLLPMSTLLFAAVAALVLLSSLRKPLAILMLGVVPLAILTILASLLLSSNYPPQSVSAGLAGHILLSALAYSFFIIAALQAAFLAFQNYQLRHHHPGGVIGRFPPLQDMEVFLFELLWVGQLLLTLGIISGFLFVENLWAEGLPHKIFFSVLAWVVFAILLWGRHQLGWRGSTAIRGTVTGCLFLLLGFYGSRFVIEFIL